MVVTSQCCVDFSKISTKLFGFGSFWAIFLNPELDKISKSDIFKFGEAVVTFKCEGKHRVAHAKIVLGTHGQRPPQGKKSKLVKI